LSWGNPFGLKWLFGMILNWNCGPRNEEKGFLKKSSIVPWNYSLPQSPLKGCLDIESDFKTPIEIVLPFMEYSIL
jgi:hypothetical protein